MVQVGVYACVVTFHSAVNRWFFISTFNVIIQPRNPLLHHRCTVLECPSFQLFILISNFIVVYLINVGPSPAYPTLGARDGVSPSDRTNAHLSVGRVVALSRGEGGAVRSQWAAGGRPGQAAPCEFEALGRRLSERGQRRAVTINSTQ